MRPRVMEVVAEDAGTFDDAPARRKEGGVYVVGSGFGFIHSAAPQALKKIYQLCNRQFLPPRL